MSLIGTRSLRRLFVWLLIVQQFLAGAGVSLPCPAASAISGERYPCEHCGCDCQSAKQCWTNCCCFTFEQKIAWAEQNGVAVPEFALAAAKQEAAARRKPACAHCSHRQSCSQASMRSQCIRTGHSKELAKDKNRSPDGISWLRALRCQGSAELWQAVTESWPGDRHVEAGLALLPRGRVELQPFLRLLFSPPSPPTPPPKTA